MPALGTHMPMTDEELNEMFGSQIPKDRFLTTGGKMVTIGQVPGRFVKKVSGGLLDYDIECRLTDGYWILHMT